MIYQTLQWSSHTPINMHLFSLYFLCKVSLILRVCHVNLRFEYEFKSTLELYSLSGVISFTQEILCMCIYFKDIVISDSYYVLYDTIFYISSWLILLPYPISYDRKAAGRYVLADCVFATASKEQTMIGEGGYCLCKWGFFWPRKKVTSWMHLGIRQLQQIEWERQFFKYHCILMIDILLLICKKWNYVSILFNTFFKSILDVWWFFKWEKLLPLNKM